MEVRVDHPANVVGPVTQLAERIFQLGSSILASVVHAVDVDELAVLFVTDTRVDEDQAVIVFDQQAA